METEFYGDGQHNEGVYFWGNLNPYIYTYQNPVNFVDPNGKQSHWATYFMSNKEKKEFNAHYPYVKAHGGSIWMMNRANDYRATANRFVTRAASYEQREPVLKLNGPVATDPDRGSDRGALRHALWSALLTKGEGLKGRIITDAHEQKEMSSIPRNDFPNTFNLNDINNADSYVDELNNRVGRIIGLKNPNNSANELALDLLNEFKNNGLYKLRKDGNQLKIVRERLNNSDYNKLYNRFLKLSNNGKDSKD